MTNRAPLQFRFDVDKFVNLMAYLAEKTNYLDPLKAMKLIYLADKDHLVRNGRPIIGDFYVRMDLGPVPSFAYSIVRDSYSPLPVKDHPNKDLFADFIRVEKPLFKKYHEFKARKSADLDLFSEEEVESIDRVLSQYGMKTGKELSDMTHNDAAWLESPMNGLIDYRLFFKDCPQAQTSALHLLEMGQEDRDYVASFAP